MSRLPYRDENLLLPALLICPQESLSCHAPSYVPIFFLVQFFLVVTVFDVSFIRLILSSPQEIRHIFPGKTLFACRGAELEYRRELLEAWTRDM